ncbi:adenosylhomocysteinase [Caldicellulosiruptoraceae bacterium PP1]
MAVITNINLWEEGQKKIEWAKKHMPILNTIVEQYQEEKPLKDLNVALSVHLEAKTAYLCLCLSKLGANMFVTGSNPLSTQDEIAAALVKNGLNVYAKHGVSNDEYFEHLMMTLDNDIDLIIDDGGDLAYLLHTKLLDKAKKIIGGCEETTTGVIRLKSLEKEGKLLFPMIAVNDAYTKHMFDNRYGTGQSTWDSILRNTNLIIAGKYVVVAGYGWCGKGIAKKAQGLGAKIIITEVDPIKALEAYMDGFEVMTMDKAAKLGDIFITATGCKDIIIDKHFYDMKDGAILCNAGHFNVEINMAKLEEIAEGKYNVRKNIDAYKVNGKEIYVIGEGRLVNLAAADGHPVEIMDMSFGLQMLSAIYVKENKDNLENKVYNVPEHIDKKIARIKLKSLGIEIDKLTDEQKEYLESWEV